jgi:hypothetical protein
MKPKSTSAADGVPLAVTPLRTAVEPRAAQVDDRSRSSSAGVVTGAWQTNRSHR